jgi:hypothetical protein
MVDAPSGYVGTERKIDLVGRFNCIVETKTEEKTENGTTSKQKTVILTVPNGYHFKEGFMLSFDSDTKPDMKIEKISKYTGHCVCECVSRS